MTTIDTHSSPSRGHYDSLSRVYDGVTEFYLGNVIIVASGVKP
jgi:hypothetical protein